MKELNRAFGLLLKQNRARLDLTQAELGKAVGLGRTAITNIESGKQAVSLYQVYEFSDVFGIDPKELLPQVKVRPVAKVTRNVGSLIHGVSDQQLLMTIMKEVKK